MFFLLLIFVNTCLHQRCDLQGPLNCPCWGHQTIEIHQLWILFFKAIEASMGRHFDIPPILAYPKWICQNVCVRRLMSGLVELNRQLQHWRKGQRPKLSPPKKKWALGGTSVYEAEQWLGFIHPWNFQAILNFQGVGDYTTQFLRELQYGFFCPLVMQGVMLSKILQYAKRSRGRQKMSNAGNALESWAVIKPLSHSTSLYWLKKGFLPESLETTHMFHLMLCKSVFNIIFLSASIFEYGVGTKGHAVDQQFGGAGGS